LPFIGSAEPERVELGATLVLRGASFLPNPRVYVASQSLDTFSAEPTDGALSLVLPAELELDGCEVPLDVTVETDHGLSEPASLTALYPAPLMREKDAAVGAGATLELHGSWLRNAIATLRGSAVPTTISGDALRVTVPRSAALGDTELLIQTPCGQANVPLTVRAAAPVLSSIDLKTVSPDGVLYVNADVPDRADVRTVRLGAREISVADDSNFHWMQPDQFGHEFSFAVRVPQDMPIDDFEIGLVTGSAGQSNTLPVAVVSPTGTHPSGPAKIRMTSLRAADDGSFPVGSTSPFAGGDFGPYQSFEQAEWVYRLHFTGEPIAGDEDAGVPTARQCNAGTFTGIELSCPQTNCVKSEYYPDVCACNTRVGCNEDPTVTCHEIRGTYQFSKDENQARFTIDRRPSGGELEEYVAGWANEDGSLVSRESPQSGTRIVARSQRTGIQLLITHYTSLDCSQN
jgi:hypothetical protein